MSLSSSGHEVYDPRLSHHVKIKHKPLNEDGSLDGGPPSNILQARFVGTCFTQVIDKEAKHANTPQAMTLKIILMMSQFHKWELAVQTLFQRLSTHLWMSQRDSCCGSSKRDSVSGAHSLETQTSTLWSHWPTETMADSFGSQTKSDPCAFTGCDSSGNINLIVMAYVDDLAFSGESSSVQSFFRETQKVFSLKHIDYLTTDHSVWRSWAEKRKSGLIIMKFLQNSLTLHISLRVTANSSVIKNSFDVLDSSWQIAMDVSMQSWHQLSCKKVVEIIVKSAGIQHWESQASPQVFQSD